MKRITNGEMKKITKKVYPNEKFSEAVDLMHQENYLVVLNKGKTRKKYSVMDKFLEYLD